MNVFPQAFSGDKPTWPPDCFAIAALILKQSGAYTELANKWPPKKYGTTAAWGKRMVTLCKQWRKNYKTSGGWPRQVDLWWRYMISVAATPIEMVSRNTDLLEALVGLVASADQTCFNFGVLSTAKDSLDIDGVIWLQSKGTLCKAIDPSRAVVLPKLHNPLTGMTLRSLTHNLAIWDTCEVKPRWKQLLIPPIASTMNLLIFPWPLDVTTKSFREVTVRNLSMAEGFRFFTFDDGNAKQQLDKVRSLVQQAEKHIGPIHGLVFPELSLSTSEFTRLLQDHPGRMVIAGVGKPARRGTFGENQVAIGTGVPKGAKPRFHLQAKHHRWRLDRQQVQQYGMASQLQGDANWWEAISLRDRECTFFTANEWLTLCVLICEDLARQDPVGELVRSVGPNLLIALLMDGPQIGDRWSARYATVLADDPRSSVLTVTGAGMVDLARWQYGGGPRSIALWKDPTSGSARQILLEPGAEAVALQLDHLAKEEWTADGRCDDGNTQYLVLKGVHQVYGAK
jgi:hypothetical protein